MYATKVMAVILLACVLSLGGAYAIAQVSAGFDLSWNTPHKGGERSSATYVIQDVVGQPFVDTSTMHLLRIESGFLTDDDHVAEEYDPEEDATEEDAPALFLPLVNR